jgi:hypothetical protein
METMSTYGYVEDFKKSIYAPMIMSRLSKLFVHFIATYRKDEETLRRSDPATICTYSIGTCPTSIDPEGYRLILCYLLPVVVLNGI